MLKSIILFLLISFCFVCSLAFQVTSDSNLPSQLQGKYIVVKGSSNHKSDKDTLQKQYLIVKASSNSKKKAYDQLNSQFRKIANYLKTVNNIPDQSSLISSKIEARYLNRRRMWLFQRIFVIYGRPQQVMTITNYLESKGVLKLQAVPAIQFLNEKIRALQAFNNAKSQMEKLLKKFPGFKILQADNLQIYDDSSSKSEQIIQQEIEDEFNDESQSDSQSQDDDSNYQNFSYCRKDLHEQLDCCPSDPWTIIKYYLGKLLKDQDPITTILVRFKIGSEYLQQEDQQEQENNQFQESLDENDQQQFGQQ